MKWKLKQLMMATVVMAKDWRTRDVEVDLLPDLPSKSLPDSILDLWS